MRSKRHGRAARNSEISSGYAVVHVPKTGGTSLRQIFHLIKTAGYEAPSKFGHGVKLEKIINSNSDVKVCVVLRDPIERTISGFYSRMRSGRPTYNSLWRPAEAAAFSFFSDPIEMLKALSSDDDRLQSAAYYAMRAIKHIKTDYRHYFNSVEMIEKHKSLFGVVGEMSRFGDFIAAIAQRSDPRITDVSPYYAHVHKANYETRPALDGFAEHEVARVTEFFAPEYAVYNHLKTLINC